MSSTREPKGEAEVLHGTYLLPSHLPYTLPPRTLEGINELVDTLLRPLLPPAPLEVAIRLLLPASSPLAATLLRPLRTSPSIILSRLVPHAKGEDRTNGDSLTRAEMEGAMRGIQELSRTFARRPFRTACGWEGGDVDVLVGRVRAISTVLILRRLGACIAQELAWGTRGQGMGSLVRCVSEHREFRWLFGSARLLRRRFGSGGAEVDGEEISVVPALTLRRRSSDGSRGGREAWVVEYPATHPANRRRNPLPECLRQRREEDGGVRSPGLTLAQRMFAPESQAEQERLEAGNAPLDDHYASVKREQMESFAGLEPDGSFSSDTSSSPGDPPSISCMHGAEGESLDWSQSMVADMTSIGGSPGMVLGQGERSAISYVSSSGWSSPDASMSFSAFAPIHRQRGRREMSFLLAGTDAPESRPGPVPRHILSHAATTGRMSSS